MIFFFFTHIGCERLVEAAVPCKKWHQQGCAARSTLHSDIVGGGLEGLWECGSVCVCEWGSSRAEQSRSSTTELHFQSCRTPKKIRLIGIWRGEAWSHSLFVICIRCVSDQCTTQVGWRTHFRDVGVTRAEFLMEFFYSFRLLVVWPQ